MTFLLLVLLGTFGEVPNVVGALPVPQEQEVGPTVQFYHPPPKLVVRDIEVLQGCDPEPGPEDEDGLLPPPQCP